MGTHSKRDEKIFISSDDEGVLLAPLLEDIFKLIYDFTLNELRRIRVPKVRQEIIEGKRKFFFEEKINESILSAKKQALEELKED